MKLRLILCLAASLLMIANNGASASARHQHAYFANQHETFYKPTSHRFDSYRPTPTRYASNRYDRRFAVSGSAYRSYASHEVGSYETTSNYETSNHYAVSSRRYEPSTSYAVGSRRYEPSTSYTASSGHGLGGRPSAWCGWEMRQLVGGDPGPEYNLARNWAHWGHAAGGPAPGVVGVMAHHVFKVISVVGPGQVLAISGNDSHAVRTRVRSISGVIAWRSA